MSVWTKLPIELYGSVWEPERFYGGQWHWDFGNGAHRFERRSSIDWAFYEHAIADVMRQHYVWWMITGRDEDFRADRPVAPWKIGGWKTNDQTWFAVGLGVAENFVAPWPWVDDCDKRGTGPWPWPKLASVVLE
jgi:hypothetical protein